MYFKIGFKGSARSLFVLTLERSKEVVDLVYCIFALPNHRE